MHVRKKHGKHYNIYNEHTQKNADDQTWLFLYTGSVVREPTSTPPPLRNGPGGPSGTPGQLTVGTPTSASKGPSPHMVRRGKSLSHVSTGIITNHFHCLTLCIKLFIYTVLFPTLGHAAIAFVLSFLVQSHINGEHGFAFRY